MQINNYAQFLHSHGILLWVVRCGLLAAVILHITASVQLWLLKRAARPEAYVKKDDLPTSYAARTMIWSGPIIAAFVIFHVLHLTVGSVLPLNLLPDGDMDVRTNVIMRLPASRRGHLLYHRHGPALHASLPRPLEHVPIAGRESSALHAHHQEIRGGLRLVRRHRQYFHPRRGARRSC